jgi:hypothetical protein
LSSPRVSGNADGQAAAAARRITVGGALFFVGMLARYPKAASSRKRGRR